MPPPRTNMCKHFMVDLSKCLFFFVRNATYNTEQILANICANRLIIKSFIGNGIFAFGRCQDKWIGRKRDRDRAGESDKL